MKTKHRYFITLLFLITGLVFCLSTQPAYSANCEGIVCEEGYACLIGHYLDDDKCRKTCVTDSDCPADSFCRQYAGICEKNCAATTLETSCGPIGAPALNTHSSQDTFFDSRTQSISCHDGELTAQISDYSEGFCQTCGDGICRGLTEDCTTCPTDCGSCSDVSPSVIVNPQVLTYEPYDLRIVGARQRGTWVPTKLDSHDVVFEWSSGYGLGSGYQLQLGTCQDDPTCIDDIFSGANPPYLLTYPEPDPSEAFPNISPYSHKVSGIPLDGNLIYVRLTQTSGQNQYMTRYVYDTINIYPHISYPEPGSALNSRQPYFSCGGENVSTCYFFVTSKPKLSDRNNVYYGYQIGNWVDPGSNTSIDYLGYTGSTSDPNANIINTIQLPLDGSDVFVHLYHWDANWGNFGNLKEKYITVNCGNGVKDEGETCDDGNIISGDGCSDSCQIELPTRFDSGTTTIRNIQDTTNSGNQEFWG